MKPTRPSFGLHQPGSNPPKGLCIGYVTPWQLPKDISALHSVLLEDVVQFIYSHFWLEHLQQSPGGFLSK
jgi:hypothetical protein